MDERHFEAKARELAQAVDCGNTERAAAVLSTDFDSHPQEVMALIREERAREQARGTRMQLDVDPDGALVFRNGKESVYVDKVDPRQFGLMQQPPRPDVLHTWNNPGPADTQFNPGYAPAPAGWNPGSAASTPPWQYNPPVVAPPYYAAQPSYSDGAAMAATALGAIALGVFLGGRAPGNNRMHVSPRRRWQG